MDVKENRTTLVSPALLQLSPRCSVAASTYIRLPVTRGYFEGSGSRPSSMRCLP